MKQNIIDEHWHHLPQQEVLDLLDTDLDSGLDTSEVKSRQERFGPNLITERKGQGALVRLLVQFHHPLIYILIAAGLTTGLLQEWVDSGVIFGVVILNAIFGYMQESKALAAINSLTRTMSSSAMVIRAGGRTQIPASQLVPGDVVLLASGDKIPADLRLLHTRTLQVDESALTGESVPVEKHAGKLDRAAVLADRKNMGFSSTLVTYGTGSGVVTSIGDSSEIGRISKLISSAEVLATPLTRKIMRFSHVLLWIILGMGAVTFFVGILRGEDLADMFKAAVALAVGAIPEGLPAVVTITLAIGVSRMAKRNAIIRKLPAVETLGSTSVICSDKTGTLTQNEMTVQEIATGQEHFLVSGVGYIPEGIFILSGDLPESKTDPLRHPGMVECLTAGLLCNDTLVVETKAGWQVEGDPTEGALIIVARKAGLVAETASSEMPRIDSVPFESEHQYMATLHDRGSGRNRVVYVKGSIESVLERCENAIDASGRQVALDETAIQECVASMAKKGLRVLAFARGNLPATTTSFSHDDVSSGLTFLGLQGMIDPPRPEAIESVRRCRAAGIRVKMITGDHGITAAAIADKLGLDGASDGDISSPVITGGSLAELSDAQLIDVADRTTVFARVTPEQKLRLVRALQSRGHIVAMTGDGVNDAPALRQSNIGVAMGITGTEVSKDAADMVLTDDNFSSIEAAVEEGRGVFDNLVKYITWTMPTSLGEGLIILVAVFAGTELPILPVQILWINMTTAVFLGLTLAFEPKELGLMVRSPRDPRTPILTSDLVSRIVLVGVLLLAGSFGLYEWTLRTGGSQAEARTVASNVLVIGELFYLFNCRSLTHSMFAIGIFKNRWLYLGVVAMVLFQLLFTYAPFMNVAFHSTPIGLEAWAYILAVGMGIYFAVEIDKSIRRLHLRRRLMAS